MPERWNRFWYGVEPGYDPMGLLRMLAVFCASRFLERDFTVLRRALDMPPELIPANLGLRILPLPYPLPAEWIGPFHALMVVACVLAFVGFLTRPALLVVAAGALYLSSGFAALVLFDHEQVLTIWFLWILVVYPSGASFSVDAVLRWWRRGRGGGRRLSAAFSLRRSDAWGYRLALVTLCLVYTAAGVAKLRYSDGSWPNGETLAFYLSLEDKQQIYLAATWEQVIDEPWKAPVALVDHGYGYGAARLGRPLSRMPTLMRAASIGTIAFELSAFLMLGPPLVAAAFLAAALVVHTVIGLTMYLGFDHYRLYILLLIDWPALGRTARGLLARRRFVP